MASTPTAAARETQAPASLSIQGFLELVVEKGATDLHVTADSPPMMRLHGELVPLPFPALTATDTKNLCYSLLTDAQRHRFEEQAELDFSFGIRGVSRFRGNLFLQRGAVGGAFRLIPYEIRDLGELGLPPVAADLTKIPRGLVLVTGPTGSGKSTTLAAMIDKVNRERREHIVTIEDPIEFVHQHKSCIVNQREVFADTHSFSEGLRHVLRQDPDVVLIGEMRDLETVEAALNVAETGHLVFSTLHTNSSVQTINRIIDIFPSNQQAQVRAQLSLVLQAVICQQLIPRMDGRGRVLAVEIMIPNPAIRNLIREEKVHQIYSQLQVGQLKFGMQTMTQSLVDLCARRLISYEEALGHATELEEVRSMLGSPHRPASGLSRPRIP
ncbi:type IV pilus twitching motility protein PilT [Candidatus Binatia bacterium]|nr:type IV pilus twitching motility protein PilT [Candidatus Binatia bacterium]